MGELRGVGFAQEDRTQTLQSPDHRRVLGAVPSLVDGRAVFGHQGARFHDVFGAKRYAGEWSVGDLRLRQHLHPRVNRVVQPLNAL